MSTDTAKRPYGFSVLVSGFIHMFRAFVPFVVVIIVNALVQALLLGTVEAGTGAAIAGEVVSAIVLLLAWDLVVISALLAVQGRTGLGAVFSAAKKTMGRFILWAILFTIVGMILFGLYSWPGRIYLILTPFLVIAAADGAANPIAANFKAIAKHPFRWLITVIITGIVVVLAWVRGAVEMFFIVNGFAAALITWVGFGILSAWLYTSWAGLYRAAFPAAGDEPGPQPAGDPDASAADEPAASGDPEPVDTKAD